jgi:hypothetical protein
MELVDLIDTLVQGYGLSDWNVLSENRQISWKDKGATGKDFEYHSNYARNGEIYLTTDGQFSHFFLEKRDKPVIWNVLLSGARGGYSNIVLDNDICGHEFDGFDKYFKKNNLIIARDSFRCGKDYYCCVLYKLKIKVHRKDVSLIEKVYCEGNCGAQVSLYFNSEGTDNIQLPEGNSLNKY